MPKSHATASDPSLPDPAGARLARASDGLVLRARRARFLGTALRAVTGAGLAAGALVLVLRAVLGVEPSRAAWTLLLLPLALAYAWGRARRMPLTRAGAAAWLDVRAGGRGDLVTGAERPDARWTARVEAALARVAMPRVALGRAGPAAAILALAFAGSVLVVPVPGAELGPAPFERLVQRGLDELADELATLEEEVTLEAVVAEELGERLESLREQVAANDPEGALAAQDRLEERLAAEAERAHEAALAAGDALRGGVRAAQVGDGEEARDAFERALEGLRTAGLDQLAPSSLDQALSELLAERGVEGASAQGVGLDPELLADLARVGLGHGALAEAGLDAEALRALANAGLDLGGLPQGGEGARLDAEALRALAEALAADPALAAALAEALANGLADKLGRLADAGLLQDAGLLSKDQLRSLAELAAELEPHVHDATCPPGGT